MVDHHPAPLPILLMVILMIRYIRAKMNDPVFMDSLRKGNQ